jgi:cell division protein FtsI (penicillin-binding protein 3)
VSKRPNPGAISNGRLYAALLLMGLCAFVLVARAVQLQVMDTDFLQGQGDARHLRVVDIPATRGSITDRNGEPLAVSTPVESVWVNPPELLQSPESIIPLARVLGVNATDIERKLTQRAEKEFVWLKRRLIPEQAERIRALAIPGVFLQKEYRRFYPAHEVTSHVLGFTNIDDIGQEGLELAYDNWMRGIPGKKRVIKDRLGRIIEEVELIQEAQPGNDLKLTIDRRLQYLAYRELQRTLIEHQARSGSVVLLDVATGEILAMVNLPAYNPNQTLKGGGESLRNRAVTDVFEPGSVIKPFIVATALESGRYDPTSPIDTAPGKLPVSGHMIRDVRDFGLIDVTRVLTKSSNVGITKIALSLEPEHIWSTYSRFGFGRVTGTGFPGESAGVLRNHQRWRLLEQATISYGYGLSVTPLQLAQAYAALANNGILRPPVFIKDAVSPPISVLDPTLANQVSTMLETIPGPDGTGKNARVANYRIAGKTGTSRKAVAAGYEDHYVASFAGYAPASNPRLVCVAVVNDPAGETYYGGQVAAPLFSRTVRGALRVLDIPPDNYAGMMATLAAGEQ